MAKIDFGEGAVFEISDDMVTQMARFDSSLSRIKENASKAASGISSLADAFGKMDVNKIKYLADSLEKMGGLTGISQNIDKAAASVAAFGSSASGTGKEVGAMNTNLSQTADLLNRLNVERPYKNLNIADLKNNIQNINTMLNQQGKDIKVDGEVVGQYPKFDAVQQQSLVNMRNMYQQELSLQQASESAKMTSLEKVAKAQNADALRQQKLTEQAQRQDEQVLQSHLKMLESKSKAEQANSDKLRAMGEQQVQQTIKNHAQMQQTMAKTVPAQLSVDQFVAIGAEIEKLKAKQESLNKSIRDYELNMARIKAGKSGTVNTKEYDSNKKESEAIAQQLKDLKAKQQIIINSNKEYQKQVQLVQSLERQGREDQRSKIALAQMREYYKMLEASSARAAANANAEAEARLRVERIMTTTSNLNAKADNLRVLTGDPNGRIKGWIDSMVNARAKLQDVVKAGVGSDGVTAFNEKVRQAVKNTNIWALRLQEVLKAVAKDTPMTNFSRIMTASAEKASMNLAQLKNQIREINTLLNHTNSNLTVDQTKQLVNLKNTYEQMAKKLATPQVSFKDAMDTSKSVKTLRDEITAVERLKQARLGLDKTDSNYRNNLQQLNYAIQSHENNLRAAGVMSDTLGTKHRNLMNISDQLARKLALMFSVSQISGYISRVAQVRGEFELQQRSLEAILQNKVQADAIFQKTVDLAVQSPFKIKELISYTKQLAAYRIEGDKLYDTTKRLADVSAGLGVDMQRLILAYGQVKAAAYLRGTEVRQFTEAGINMYGELQNYFKEVKGQAYTTAQIVDMISKRMVSFKDVEAVFQRITDKGGLFYNMQAIQAETLQGKIANLQDSIDVMLNGIGTQYQGVFKGVIDTTKTLIDNWNVLANVAKALIAALVAVKVASLTTSKEMIKLAVANGVVADRFRKSLTIWQLMATGIKNVIPSIKALKVALKSIAIMAVIDWIFNVIAGWNDLANAMRDNFKSYDEARAKINNIAVAFDNLAAARKKAKDTNNVSFNFAENLEKEKAELEKLYDELQQRKLEIPVDIKNVDEKNIEQAFKDAKEKLYRFERATLDMSNFIAKDDNSFVTQNFSWFVDGFTEKTKDLEDSANSLRDFASAVDVTLNALGANYESLSKQAKDAYNSIKNGPKDGEAQAAYLQRVNIELKKIQDSLRDSTGKFPDWFSQAQDGLRGFSGAIIDLNGHINASYSDFNKLFDDIRAKTANFKGWTDKEKSAFFDYAAEKLQFGEFTRYIFVKLASKTFNFKVNADEGSVNDSISYVDKLFSDFFKKKKFKILITPTYVAGNEDMNQNNDYIDNQIKAYKKNKELIKQAERATVRLNKDVDNFTYANQLRQANEEIRQTVIAWGRGDELIDKKEAREAKRRQAAAAKAERDIWSERIAVLKEMQQQYEKIRQHYGNKTSQSMVLSNYMEALRHVQISSIMKPEDIIPSKEGIINALRKVLASMPKKLTDYYKKSSELKKDIAQLHLEIDTERANKALDDTKQKVDNLFNGLDLYKKLRSAGLYDSQIQQMFPNLAKNLDDVQKGINDSYNQLRDANGLLGVNEQKANNEAINNLNKKRTKEEEDLIVELTKAYKTQLSERLQLDTWYYDERAKIARSKLTPEQKEDYKANLLIQYNKKADENAWNDFKKSDSYLNLFSGDLESMSTKTLDMMKKKLDNMRESLKNLDPTNLKEITDLYKQMENITSERSPLSSFIADLKEIKRLKSQGLTEDILSANIKANDEAIAKAQNELDIINRVINLKQNGHEADTGDDQDSFIADNFVLVVKSIPELRTQSNIIQDIINKKKEENKVSEKGLNTYSMTRVDAENLKKAWAQLLQQAKAASQAVIGMLQAMGEDTEGIAASLIDITMNIADAIVQALMFAAAMKAVGIASKTAMGVIGYILIAIEAVASIITSIVGINDKEKEKSIKEIQRKIDALTRSYENLKKAMDDAWNISELQNFSDNAIKNLEVTNQMIRSQIALEQDKKKSDQDKINEYYRTIEDNEKKIKELQESRIQEAGGLGSKANWKSAAQDFADAWVDAFNEGSDTLDALNKKFDDLIANMIKKQVMLRVVSKYLEPIFKMIDAAVDENSPGGIKVMKEELQGILSKIKDTTPELNDMLKTLMDALGYTPTNATSLTALEQGIQSVTEETAKALEALLNSMRFYLANQQNDVAAIRNVIQNWYSFALTAASYQQLPGTPTVPNDTATNSMTPILAELKSQTGYIMRISEAIDSITATNPNVSGKGIRVFLKNM